MLMNQSSAAAALAQWQRAGLGNNIVTESSSQKLTNGLGCYPLRRMCGNYFWLCNYGGSIFSKKLCSGSNREINYNKKG